MSSIEFHTPAPQLVTAPEPEPATPPKTTPKTTPAKPDKWKPYTLGQ